MPALLPVKKKRSSPLCLKLRITPQSVTCVVTGDKTANVSAHRLPPKPRPFTFTPNRKRAAIRWNGWLGIIRRSAFILSLLYGP